MKTTPKKESSNQIESQTPMLGEYAYQVIRQQYQAIVKLEKKVLADVDPEHLHHMRVGTRRLRTALQVFEQVIELPKAAQAKRVGALAKILGKLRDLDVQIADLRDRYRPCLPEADQELIDEAISQLKRERRKAFAATEDALTRSRYRDMKTAYDAWLSEPRYTTLAQLPLVPVLPDLLSPLLATLLLHPGWLVPANQPSLETDQTLHDLRKACKHARYQAEFFEPFYGRQFKDWIAEIKTIQSFLGDLHDAQVLADLLRDLISSHPNSSKLQTSVRQTLTESMADWEAMRRKYLDPDFRHQLHQLILEPTAPIAENFDL